MGRERGREKGRENLGGPGPPNVFFLEPRLPNHYTTAPQSYIHMIKY